MSSEKTDNCMVFVLVFQKIKERKKRIKLSLKMFNFSGVIFKRFQTFHAVIFKLV